MPIFAPLADTVGIPRFVIVTAYQFGQYAMLFLAPTIDNGNITNARHEVLSLVEIHGQSLPSYSSSVVACLSLKY